MARKDTQVFRKKNIDRTWHPKGHGDSECKAQPDTLLSPIYQHRFNWYCLYLKGTHYEEVPYNSTFKHIKKK